MHDFEVITVWMSLGWSITRKHFSPSQLKYGVWCLVYSSFKMSIISTKFIKKFINSSPYVDFWIRNMSAIVSYQLMNWYLDEKWKFNLFVNWFTFIVLAPKSKCTTQQWIIVNGWYIFCKFLHSSFVQQSTEQIVQWPTKYNQNTWDNKILKW